MPFRYFKVEKSKKEIRLIRLKPLRQSTTSDRTVAEIECSFERASLDEGPVYTALSYTWGDPNVTKKILLDQEPFEVTVNLHAALQHLQHETEELTLWVDAILIYQPAG